MNAVSRRELLLMNALATVPSSGQHASAAIAATYQKIDEFVKWYMREWSTPGLALAITNRKKLVRLRSYGFSDAGARVPVSPGTLFQIGSISKTFAAVAALQLHEDGKLDLHAPLTRYLPWFRIGSKHRQPTVHHVLSHTSGIPANRDDLPSSLYQAVALSEREAAFAPGARFAYSNVAYQVLGQIIEVVAGEEYSTYLRRRIFEPLDMKRAEPLIRNEILHFVEVGYATYYDDRPRHPSQPLAPATWVEWGPRTGTSLLRQLTWQPSFACCSTAERLLMAMYSPMRASMS